MSASLLARAGAILAVVGSSFVFIHLITGAYPPLVIGLVYLALGPGILMLLFLTLFAINVCLIFLRLLTVFYYMKFHSNWIAHRRFLRQKTSRHHAVKPSALPTKSQ
jgi:hypothetical protein